DGLAGLDLALHRGARGAVAPLRVADSVALVLGILLHVAVAHAARVKLILTLPRVRLGYRHRALPRKSKGGARELPERRLHTLVRPSVKPFNPYYRRADST